MPGYSPTALIRPRGSGTLRYPRNKRIADYHNSRGTKSPDVPVYNLLPFEDLLRPLELKPRHDLNQV